jgi:hypothetical protein
MRRLMNLALDSQSSTSFDRVGCDVHQVVSGVVGSPGDR